VRERDVVRSSELTTFHHHHHHYHRLQHDHHFSILEEIKPCMQKGP
jgi:hypothetical protein